MIRFRQLVLVLLLLAALVGVQHAATSLDRLQAARDLLGPDVLSRIVRIDNTAVHTRYPSHLYALVFEVGGLLWFYQDDSGTQSFSRHSGDLAAEKADFAPLLRAIDPGFTAFTVVADGAAATSSADREPLPNGCFIESYAALRNLIAHGELVAHVRFLLLYFNVGPSSHGHALLAYDTPRGSFTLDASESDRTPQPVPAKIAHDALAVAREVLPELEITQARWVPADVLAHAPVLAAVTP